MKPFKFSLEVVRTLRQRKEQQQMENYARALQEQRQTIARLQQVQGELESAWSEWHAAMAEGCQAVVVGQTQRYFQSVELRRQECLAAVREAERVVQEALGSMLRARQDREAVEVFLEHQQVAYDRELQREERKLLDEMAQRRTLQPLSWAGKNPHDS
jgi:flagellar export protein FliJ